MFYANKPSRREILPNFITNLDENWMDDSLCPISSAY